MKDPALYDNSPFLSDTDRLRIRHPHRIHEESGGVAGQSTSTAAEFFFTATTTSSESCQARPLVTGATAATAGAGQAASLRQRPPVTFRVRLTFPTRGVQRRKH